MGDKVATDASTLTGIFFSNSTSVGINLDTLVQVDTEASVVDITSRSLLKKFLLSLGTLWCKIIHQAEQESFTVETRGGVLGTRG